MKRILGSIRKNRSSSGERSNSVRSSPSIPQGDGPEATVYREVTAFCESGAPNSQSTGDEYLHLPAIVEAAESSPGAATQAAIRIRTYLGRDHFGRGYAQYNAIMLMRILTDNPGRPFTQNFDKEFVATVKKLLREGKDTSVQQILRETLDYLEVEKSRENNSLGPIMEMWRKEKGMGARLYPHAAVGDTAVFSSNDLTSAQMGPPLPTRPPRGLPPPEELAGRIEEAKTTARLLVQTVQSAPMHELLANELVREFADRARSAQKSIQGYINSENPPPDNDTMLTLIETAEQLNVAMSKHQRAVLQARKATGAATPSPQPQPNAQNAYVTGGENVYNHTQPYQQVQQPALSPPVTNGYGRASPVNDKFTPPAGPPPGRQNASVYTESQLQGSNNTAPTSTRNHEVTDNPFADDAGYDQPQQPQHQQNYSLFGRNPSPARVETSAYARPGTDNPYSPEPAFSPQAQRPAAYNQAFVSTPSYMHRQDSAAAHITMHGASPPTEAQK